MGLTAFLVDLALEVLNSWKFGTVTRAIASAGGFWAPYISFLFFTMGFATLSGCIVSFAAPLAAGSGIPEVKSYLNGVHVSGAACLYACCLPGCQADRQAGGQQCASGWEWGAARYAALGQSQCEVKGCRCRAAAGTYGRLFHQFVPILSLAQGHL